MATVAERYFTGQGDNYAEPVGSDLEETLSDVAYVSRVLHGIGSGGELSAETLSDLCVCLFNAESRLAAMKEAAGGAC
jgi:hypothetical protein